MRSRLGRAEFESLPQCTLLHQYPRPRAGHRSFVCSFGETLLGISDAASLGRREQRLPAPCTSPQSPAPHPGNCVDVLGLFPSILDLAASTIVPARGSARGAGGHAGDD